MLAGKQTMVRLTNLEKRRLEVALRMEGGYVLDFNNRAFTEFFRDTVGVDINDPRFLRGSGSKANRLRAFWDVGEPRQVIAVLEAFVEGWADYAAGTDSSEKATVSAIASRLRGDILHRSVSSRPAPRRIEEIQFAVALSFPGECRGYVEQIAIRLKSHLGQDRVFYDTDFQAQLARPDLDLLLQNVFNKQSALVVVFLSSDYSISQWCGLEWRAVREILKRKQSNQVMFIRFDEAIVDGALSIDGYIDARRHNPEEISKLILERASVSPGI